MSLSLVRRFLGAALNILKDSPKEIVRADIKTTPEAKTPNELLGAETIVFRTEPAWPVPFSTTILRK